ncbi:phage virion morphogenesis protein [Roseibium sp. TrichSKD4]|uniref:phage virion morphogenesis protein n=1 Tax=Roseibium sp. TrichSKD4 TaxID=744980 RepID=UPI0001E569B6|nr:phage virion morphogenesis protein [Roseibium sp. TrichSKD4]EFO32489.1 phage virion morphogenesis protein [Roseibium sp. TrichSKD4]
MLSFRFDGSHMDKELRALIDKFEDTATAHKIIGLTLYDQTVDRFENETAPDGSKWEPLSALTLSLRRNAQGILRDKGDLFASIHHTHNASRAEVGTNLNHPKVWVMQNGATIRPRRAKALRVPNPGGPVFLQVAVIPARPYIGIGIGDEEAVRDALIEWLSHEN